MPASPIDASDPVPPDRAEPTDDVMPTGETGSAEPTDEPVDGRTARRERNRDAVLDAVLDLFAEGSVSPAPPEVAARSGVSLRSVYRYFDDEDQLIRSAIARNIERVQPYIGLEAPGEGEVGSRIDRTVDARLSLYERARPMMRAAVHRAHSTPTLAARLVEVTQLIRTQTAEMFDPELSQLPPEQRRELLDALDVVLSYDGIDHLRGGLGRSPDEAGAAMRRSLWALLARN